MKKLSTAIFTLALLASASAIDAHAADTPPAGVRTGTLTLQGVIGPSCFMTVVPYDVATSLNLSSSIAAINVAEVSAQCNLTSNYEVVVTSLNKSLKNFTTDPDTTVNYDISLTPWPGFGTGLNGPNFTSTTTDPIFTFPITSATQQRSRVTLRTQTSTNVPGMYQDTLTFTLTTI